MRQADIKDGTVYVGRCGIRFRRFIIEEAGIRFEQVHDRAQYGFRHAKLAYNYLSLKAAARWAERKATAEEAAAFDLAMWTPAEAMGDDGGTR